MLDKAHKEKIKREIQLFLKSAFQENGPASALNAKLKSDQTIVTDADHFISNLVKTELGNLCIANNLNFVSEEDYDELSFPCLVLDPIDGTRELVKGLAECSLSLAIMWSPQIDDPKNFAWIYNPFTGFEIDSNQTHVASLSRPDFPLSGLVSRSEMRKGFTYDQLRISPRGSIAFKLGLLACGACDFVFSQRPKNIWDIAAGSILCSSRGIDFYNGFEQIKSLTEMSYNPPFLWSHKDFSQYLKRELLQNLS